MSDETASDDILDAVDAAALVRRLAEEGVEGVRSLLADRAQHDAELARRIASLRERLRRQASRAVGRVLEEYDRRAAELDQVRIRERDRMDEELRRLEERLRAARSLNLKELVDPGLLTSVREALLAPSASWMQPKRRSLWEWIKAFFARLADFFRKLFRRSPKGKARKAPGRSVVFATLAAEGRRLEASMIGEALAQLSGPERDELKERLDDTFHRQARDLGREAEAKRREAEAQQRRLEEEREEARRRAERDVEGRVREAEARRVERELKDRGLVAERGGALAVTYGLVERFARLILQEESRSLPGEALRSLHGATPTGIYEKARQRQPDEIAHIDIPSTLLEARLGGWRHLDEGAGIVYREVTAERVHLVLAFDKSGSMQEERKLEAAKKALLALYIAIRRRYPDATIDVAAFDNEVRLLDLVELWETPAGSFTNTAEALHLAHLLLRPSRASRKEVYLITDGLPESYTEADGRVRSGNLDRALEVALGRAAELATVTPLRFTMILLKSENPEYERAARLLTRALHGELVITDPGHLGFELLVQWAAGTETRRPAVGLPTESGQRPPTPGPAPSARRRRRRADRRMGG